jgi:hypothetical protein
MPGQEETAGSGDAREGPLDATAVS